MFDVLKARLGVLLVHQPERRTYETYITEETDSLTRCYGVGRLEMSGPPERNFEWA